MTEYDSVKVKDQLGRPEDKNITIKRKYDELIMESNAVKIEKNTIGHSLIWGHPVNGIYGSPALGVDGEQLVWGEAGRTRTLVGVKSPNNIFREHLRDDEFIDTASTTAYLDTTNFRIAMSSSSLHSTVYNTIVLSEVFFYDNLTITEALFNATETKYGSDIIKYYIGTCDTEDGTYNWEEITNGVNHSFTNTGKYLRYKVLFIGNGGSDTYIEEIQINYS